MNMFCSNITWPWYMMFIHNSWYSVLGIWVMDINLLMTQSVTNTVSVIVSILNMFTISASDTFIQVNIWLMSLSQSSRQTETDGWVIVWQCCYQCPSLTHIYTSYCHIHVWIMQNGNTIILLNSYLDQSRLKIIWSEKSLLSLSESSTYWSACSEYKAKTLLIKCKLVIVNCYMTHHFSFVMKLFRLCGCRN